ncbi:MAG: hypothetical protein CFE43_12780 [Burkholderiales bacterium PBB3]|nr:MAG: hypothetical protein CFE43_12780 [Burkholderiales bacterium PBB3]
MRNLPFKRHLVCLVIGSQLMGCTGAVGAAPQNDDWAPAAPLARPIHSGHGHYLAPSSQVPVPSFGPVAVRPNFQAPSANTCSRSIRTREVPGREGQAQSAAPGTDLWAAAGSLRAEKESSLGKAMPERRRDAAVAEASAPAAPALVAPPPPPAPMGIAAPARAMADSAAPGTLNFAAPAAKAAAPQIERRPAQAAPVNPIVTAGVIDDNANFAEYLAFRQRTQVAHNPRDIADRYLLQVRDGAGRSVSDAEVRVQSPSGQAMWARTDAGGQVWVSPNAFDTSRANTYQISVRKPGRWGMTQATAFLQRGQKSAIDVTLDAAPQQRAQLDLVFLIDATGSMGDEIDKLKTTLRTIANEVANLPAKPDLCFGLVAYRDKGDEYLIRSHDFTNDLGAFQGVLNQLQAGGGGDYPEAMNEALHDTVHNLSWRGSGTTRMVFLLADAPPHLDYGGPQYDDSMQAALGKGIKVFSVGASGLDKQGEYIQRQIAQYTGGKFVFLTYAQAHNPASGPGRETSHDVQNYSVDSLDRLIVRLVREDLAKLGKS